MDTEARIEGFHAPQQDRSRRSLARMAEATEALLLERGPDRITVQNVVARADSSVGAFYARFRSKDDAVAYVHRRFWDEVRERWSEFLAPERWSGVPAEVLIAEVIRRYCRVFLSDDGRARAFLLELLTRGDRALLERIRKLDEEIAEMMGRLLEMRSGRLRHPRPREAAEDGFRRVLSAVRDHVLFGGAGAVAVERGVGGKSRDGGARSGSEARVLILSLTQMYGGMLGIDQLPSSYAELREMCAASRRVRWKSARRPG